MDDTVGDDNVGHDDPGAGVARSDERAGVVGGKSEFLSTGRDEGTGFTELGRKDCGPVDDLQGVDIMISILFSSRRHMMKVDARVLLTWLARIP